VVLAEREINDYLKPEIDALKAAIERVGKAIDEEAAKGQGEDWSLMVGYVQAWSIVLPSKASGHHRGREGCEPRRYAICTSRGGH
jgi:hypothetical protein